MFADEFPPSTMRNCDAAGIVEFHAFPAQECAEQDFDPLSH
jgi:hypothetical protein